MRHPCGKLFKTAEAPRRLRQLRLPLGRGRGGLRITLRQVATKRGNFV
jgi:hypothetical protein